MRHAEVAQAPRQRGDDAQRAESAGRALRPVVALRHVQITRQRLRAGEHGLRAARQIHAEEHDDDQRDRHEDGLDEVGGGHGQEAAQHRIADDDRRADEHGHVVVPAKQAAEQHADGLEAGGGVGHKEHDDDQCGNQGEQMALVPVAAGEVIRHGDGAQVLGVDAQALGHQQEVEIGAHRQTDDGPADLRQSGEVRQTRQAHQQIGAHVGGLRAHGGDQRAELAAAEVKIAGARRTAAGKRHTDANCHDEVQRHGQRDNHPGCVHRLFLQALMAGVYQKRKKT